MSELFNVVQFFENDEHEYVRRDVTSLEAMKAFAHYCTSIGAKIGMTKRVIVTDSGDSINAEWEYGKGFTFPPELVGCDPAKFAFGLAINGDENAHK